MLTPEPAENEEHPEKVVDGTTAPDIPELQTYKRRWYILAVFGFQSAVQILYGYVLTILWTLFLRTFRLTFSVIARNTMSYYDYKIWQLNLLPLLGGSVGLLSMPLSARFIEAVGVRNSVIMSSFLSSMAGLSRLAARGPHTSWILPVSQLINSLGGSIHGISRNNLCVHVDSLQGPCQRIFRQYGSQQLNARWPRRLGFLLVY